MPKKKKAKARDVFVSAVERNASLSHQGFRVGKTGTNPQMGQYYERKPARTNLIPTPKPSGTSTPIQILNTKDRAAVDRMVTNIQSFINAGKPARRVIGKKVASRKRTAKKKSGR